MYLGQYPGQFDIDSISALERTLPEAQAPSEEV